MGVKLVFSNCLGVLVFNPDFSLVETVKVKDLSVDFTQWLSEEKQVVSKYSGDDLFYLGFKKEKLDGIKLSQDPDRISRLINFLRSRRDELHSINLQRTKVGVRGSVNDDLLIIQAINNIDEINKAVNLLSKRLREWYELYNPEFSKSLDSHEAFVNLILEKDKDTLLSEVGLKNEQSMGADLKDSDLAAVKNLAEEIKLLFGLKEKQEKYLESVMLVYCPNLTAIAGHLIAAKLLEHAGSLEKLAGYPSSTVQLLGAEKALFRHMKTGSKCPKYGVIFSHYLVAKARMDIRGKVARALADKLSIAAKVDHFRGEFVGDRLRSELEERFR
jgi:nucleolar protein 56